MYKALSIVVLTTGSISLIMLKAIPLSVWRVELGLSSVMKRTIDGCRVKTKAAILKWMNK